MFSASDAWAVLFRIRNIRCVLHLDNPTLKFSMRKFLGLLVVLSLSCSSIAYAPLASAKLKSPYEIKLKAAKKVRFGQAVPLAVESCKTEKKKKKLIEKCVYEKFVVKVKSFEFYGKETPIDKELSTFAIDVTMQNYSSQEVGLEVGSLLQCKSSKSDSNFYADGIDPQFLPAKSTVSGTIISSFPDDIAVSKCKMPVLWLSVNYFKPDLKNKTTVAQLKKKKLVGVAYIALTPKDLVETPTLSVSQKNAKSMAQSYMDFTSFSRSGLIKQLVYEGFSTEDATVGVDALSVNWREEAVKMGRSYLSLMPFSRSGLIDQLVFEGFSTEDATYGVTQNGL